MEGKHVDWPLLRNLIGGRLKAARLPGLPSNTLKYGALIGHKQITRDHLKKETFGLNVTKHAAQR